MLNATCTRICFIIIIFFASTSLVSAQQASFIYFQSENNLPYQIQWKGQNFPSSSSGYLVIPQVMPGEHSLVVAIAPEYAYKITIADKPRGFSIRQSADNKWSLFDMIDFSSVQGNVLVKNAKPVDTDKLLEQAPMPPVEKKQLETQTSLPVVVEKKPVETPSQLQSEKKPLETPSQAVVEKKKNVETPTVTVKSVENASVQKDIPLPKKESTIKSLLIQKIFDKEGSSGIDQVYIVQNGSKSDTIALFIPVLKEEQTKQIPGQIAKTSSIPVFTNIASPDLVWSSRSYGLKTRYGLQLK